MKRTKRRNGFHRPSRWQRGIFLFVTVTLVASIIFISVSMALAPTEPDPSRPNHRILHTFSGAMLGALGFSFITLKGTPLTDISRFLHTGFSRHSHNHHKEVLK